MSDVIVTKLMEFEESSWPHMFKLSIAETALGLTIDGIGGNIGKFIVEKTCIEN